MRKALALITLFFFGLTCLLFSEEKKDQPSTVASKSLNVSGYTQFQYSYWDTGANSFLIRRARVTLAGEILKNILYKIQVDAVKSPLLLDAQVEFKIIPQAILKVGQFKVPFSLENLTSSSDLDTINRSQAEEKLCPGRDIGSQGRDIGAVLTGKFTRVEYTLGIFNGSGINKTDNNDMKDVAARVILSPLDALSCGASFYKGKYSSSLDAPPVRRDRVGLELYLHKGDLSLKGEYIFAKDDVISKSGWYLQAGYFFIPKKLQSVLKFDSYDKDRGMADDQKDIITLGVNWFLSGKTKFQVNYEIYREESGKVSDQAVLALFQAGF